MWGSRGPLSAVLFQSLMAGEAGEPRRVWLDLSELSNLVHHFLEYHMVFPHCLVRNGKHCSISSHKPCSLNSKKFVGK